MNLSTLVQDYMEAKDRLTHYKKRENALRLAMIDAFFPNESEGTANTGYEQFSIKGTFKMNHKLKNMSEEELDSLTEEELDCIAMKPSLILSKYKALEDSDLLDELITVTPALPSLVVKFNDQE